jgi:hypothetical protein
MAGDATPTVPLALRHQGFRISSLVIMVWVGYRQQDAASLASVLRIPVMRVDATDGVFVTE